MSAAWVPPRPTYHLRVFLVSLGLVVTLLAGFLFGVSMEATVPARGVIVARDQQDLRALVPGLIESGWFEGEVLLQAGNVPVGVRLDHQGNGIANPALGQSLVVSRFELIEGNRRDWVQDVRFHRLQPGDKLWPGQPVAEVRADELRMQLDRVEDQLKETESRREPGLALVRERDRLRQRLAQAVLHAPETAGPWLVLDVPVAPLQAVRAGDVVARVAPIDPASGQPRDLVARLEIDEGHFADVTVDQTVRVSSNLRNPRLHGRATARVERLEPLPEDSPGQGPRFHAVAPIVEAPFALALGSTFRAEIVVGRKRVYRIILEH